MRTPAPYLIAAALLLAPSAADANPWFPLKPGTTWVYKGSDEGRPGRDVVRVTQRTKVIAGVRCRVIRDRLFLRGKLREHTLDYYAEDAKGNVRYYGEDTAELDRRGRVTSREGSWRTGRDGARSGLFMPAHPKVGDGGFQEHYPGHAEDQFRVVSKRHGVLTTHEHTRLEPGVLDRKRYRRGIGEISEDSLKGGNEHFKLVAVRRG